MKDADVTGTGPDHYFDKALPYPEFAPSSPHTRKFWFHQTSDSTFHIYHEDASIGGRIIYPAKDFRGSHASMSPRSESTGETSNSTLDDDLDSHCGSLAYSVESWGVGHMLGDEEHQRNVEVDLPLLVTRTHSEEHNVFDPCFRPLSWVISLLQESFRNSSPNNAPTICEDETEEQPQRT